MPDATIESTETDKTKINLAYTVGANGAFIIKDNTGVTWTVTSDAEWLPIATSAAGASAAATAKGTGDKTLYAYAATANTSTTAARTATITLTRLGMPSTPAKTITVTQAKPLPTSSTVTPTSIWLSFKAGESAAFTIDNKESGLEWTVTSSDDSWLQIATDGMGADAATSKTGTANTTLYAFAKTANASTTADRAATITLSREGMTNIKINVTQTIQGPYTPPPHKGWAGCNVYWEPDYVNTDGTTGRLTFDDVGETTHNNHQGVYFKWGSLVAISPMGNYNASTSVLFSPTGEKGYVSASIIPYAQPDRSTTNRTQDYLRSIHNPNANLGDICRYITERGWAPGATAGKKWRMPVSSDFDEIINYETFGSFQFLQSYEPNGCHIVGSGIYKGSATFPTTGIMTNEGVLDASYLLRGDYYTSSASPYDNAYTLWINSGGGNNYELIHPRVAMVVRCVEY